MTSAAIVGVGQTKIERWKLDTPEEMVCEATRRALANARIGIGDIDAVFYGVAVDMFHGHFAPDRLVLGASGGVNRPTIRISTSGSTGLTAAIEACKYLIAGMGKIALVVCFEKMSDTRSAQAIFNTVYDELFVRPSGINVALQVPIEMRRFMYKYGITEEQCALVSVKNHRNACNNPYAQMPMPNLTVKDVLASPPLALPVRLLHISPVSDGAVALVLAHESLARELVGVPVWIRGYGHWSDSVWFMSRRNNEMAYLSYMNKAVRKAYAMAGISNPREQIHAAEVVDPFTFKELQVYEAAELCGEGESGRFIESGATQTDGKIPVNASGGLLGEGNPIGAQPGLRIKWATQAIRGDSEVLKRDVENALVVEWGGMYQYGAAMVLSREKYVN
jgi:acetyl-CoA C-acetyltransferase